MAAAAAVRAAAITETEPTGGVALAAGRLFDHAVPESAAGAGGGTRVGELVV